MTKSTPFLQPGNYMKTTTVLNFLNHFPVERMKANKLTKHIGEYDVYFNTEDLKAIMHKDVFVEMECECITHMIMQEHC